MRVIDTLSIAFMNLWRRKMRAFLTVLGMVIGTASIVVMVSLGIGINEVFEENYAGMGSLTTITVQNYQYVDPNQQQSGRAMQMMEVKLDAKAVNAMYKIKGVTAVMPMVQVWGFVKSGQYSTDVGILGVDIEAAEAFGFNLAEGRLPNANTGTNYEIVFGSYTLKSFYQPKTGKQALDREGNSKINMEHSRFQLTFDSSNIYDYGMMGSQDPNMPTPAKGKFYKVNPVGVMEEGNDGYYSIMDINAIKKLAKENKTFMGSVDMSTYNQVWIKCASTDDVLAVNDAVHGLGFASNTPLEWLQFEKQSTAQLQALLGAIGGVALLVAAIGIMNTMMMSIYERTREIGIIKVLGCRMANIARLFLTESAYIGLFGGAIGLMASYGISIFLNAQLVQGAGMRSVIPLWLSLGAVIFSIFVAIASGMYPALRAMRLSALTAIRSE